MTQKCLPVPFSDEVLVAYLDNQLSRAEREQFARRLQEDEILSERLTLLSHSSLPFHDAFEPMLAQAPLAALQARLDAIPEAVRPVGISRRRLLAASVSFLAVGLLAGRYSAQVSAADSNWRERVAGYMSLYTAQTLADVNDTAEQQQQQLSRVQNTLGIALSPAALAVPGATLKNARILHYDDYDIAQISYLDEEYGPMALCITRSEQQNSTPQESEIRQGMNVVYWRNAGYNFMFIGHCPAAEMAVRAGALRATIA
ncbi:anti-sigma factor family protein [Ewingella americana]|uniref:Anti-sigma factor n=1 Tax=Ewingella americana TaxID=41202 RepID=A0A502G5B6_9GAMM|nr:anti-sigma factor [Ewingella americana]TPG57004.1 anti-sigma factor [Ewingella americana]